MPGRSPRKPDSVFAGSREVPRRNTEVGCYFAWGMIILNDDRPGRSVINDERSCAAYEKKYSGEKRELADKHWDLLSATHHER